MRGKSVAAGREAMAAVALTRIAIPAPVLLLPPYLIGLLERGRLMPTARGPRAVTELGKYPRIDHLFKFCGRNSQF